MKRVISTTFSLYSLMSPSYTCIVRFWHAGQRRTALLGVHLIPPLRLHVPDALVQDLESVKYVLVHGSLKEVFHSLNQRFHLPARTMETYTAWMQMQRNVVVTLTKYSTNPFCSNWYCVIDRAPKQWTSKTRAWWGLSFPCRSKSNNCIQTSW